MRAQAKRSSAANRDGSAGRGSVFGRSSAATRASSLSADGSGAPSQRARLAVLALALATLGLLCFAPLTQARTVLNGFAYTHPANAANSLGGQFGFTGGPGGVAVNDSGAGGVARGTFYVADSLSRVQRFSPSGAFERTWGQDVIATSYNERQHLEVAATGGTYTLSFKGQTTDPIPYDALGVQVIDALKALGTIDGNITGGPSGLDCVVGNTHCFWDFAGPFSATDVPQVTVGTSQLDGSATVITLVDGVDAATTGGSSTGFEICVVARHCKIGTTSGTSANGGQLISPQDVAVNQATGDVYVTEQGNRRISQFDADGNFVRTWGWDVITSGRPGDLGAAFEICTVAADCKQAAAAGVNGGQFSGTLGDTVVDAAGNVWVADAGNRRLQEFDSSGNFIAAYGFNVNGGGALESCASTVAGVCGAGTQGSGSGQFSAGNPRSIAFDNGGNLYAIDAGNNRVQRFDPVFATASPFAGPAFAALTTVAPELVAPTQGGTHLAFEINRNIGSPAERQIVEIDPSDETVKDTSLAGAGMSANISGGSGSPIHGLAADATSGNLYASVHTSLTRFKVLLLGAAPPAVGVSLNTPAVTSDTAVTFGGSVDPGGAWVGGCHFQYSTDRVNWHDVATSQCESFDVDGGPQVVTAGVGGLDPSTDYFVRLRASRPLVPGSTVTSFMRTFRTDSVPPVVSDVGAVQVGDTSARMVGTIDPRNSDSGYFFEYGTTPALGSTTPPLNVGGGTTPITVSRVVDGLSPATPYYFRLTATNAYGATSSDQKTFTTRVEPLPDPGGRGWEMVTPPDKNYGDADNVAAFYPPNRAASAPDGNSVGFCSTALFGEPAGRMTNLCAPYMSRRTAGGWQTSNPFPPFCKIDPFSGGFATLQHALISPDFSRYVIQQPEASGCDYPALDPAAPLNEDPLGLTARNLYYQDPGTDPATFKLLNTATVPSFDGDAVDNRWTGGDEDFSHVVYVSNVNQTPEPDSPAPGDFQKLYLWQNLGEGGCAQAGGCLSLLSVRPDGSPIVGEAALPFTGAFKVGGSGFVNPYAVSTDGQRVYFQNEVRETNFSFELRGPCVAACDLYLREGGTTTVEVGVSECTLGAGCGDPERFADEFIYATPSGDNAFFASCARLTDASLPEGRCPSNKAFDPSLRFDTEEGARLYRWDASAAAGNRLVDLMVDPEPGNGADPRFHRWIGAADDGETAFFSATGQLVVDGTQALSVYRWRWNAGSPEVDYLGPYAAVFNSGNTDINGNGLRRLVTPDGRYLMLYSPLRLDPVVDHDADIDVYRWGEAEGWQCISCQVPGDPSAGSVDLTNVYLTHYETAYPSISMLRPRVLMSDDGRRIFFGTPDALAPGDTNGEAACPVDDYDNNALLDHVYACTDVYEWHDGTVSLASSGTGASGARLIAGTPAGEDVFFFTRQRLVGWDVDNNTDIYDARIGGGFPEPPPAPAECEGEACRGPAPVAADIPGAGTAAFRGSGNPSPAPNACNRISKKAQRKAGAAKRAARKGRANRARALRKQASNLNRRAKRCNRRQGR